MKEECAQTAATLQTREAELAELRTSVAAGEAHLQEREVRRARLTRRTRVFPLQASGMRTAMRRGQRTFNARVYHVN